MRPAVRALRPRQSKLWPTPWCRLRRRRWRRCGGSYGSRSDVPRLAVQCGYVFGVHDADAALSWSTYCSSLLFLGLFDHDLLIRIADALTLVGLRGTNGTDLSSQLTYGLAVSTLDHDLSRSGGSDGDALRGFKVHRVREANAQV